MNTKKLTPRLLAAAEFITPGVTVADIGTDHASLPIYLVSGGICPKALAADLRKGPLESAKRNISLANLDDKITTRLSDGFDSISENEFDEAVLAGMGGLLISELLSKTPYINKKSLVLQPMSDAHELRLWLCKNGFAITKEKAVCEKQRVYVIMRVEYSGEKIILSDFEAYTGKLLNNFGKDEECFIGKQIRMLNKQINGQKSVGADTSDLECLMNKLLKICQK